MSDAIGVQGQNIIQQPGQGQGQTGLTGQITGGLDASQLARLAGQSLRNGTLVSGTVIGMNKDGSYLVQIQDMTGGGAQRLNARATLPLIVGQGFRAIWDNTGESPILRLSERDFALLSKFAEGADKEVATALLSRGLPVTSEMIRLLRIAWKQSGEANGLNSALELWARDLPMTSGNIQIVSWYLAQDKKEISKNWAKVRQDFKERLNKGESPLDALKSLSEGESDAAKFLRGHSMLSKSLKQGVDVSSMAAASWSVGDGENPLLAKIWVSSDNSGGESGRVWNMVGFEIEGETLGEVSGEVESDSQSYVVGLRAEYESSYQTLRLKRDALRKELEDVPLSLQYIGVNHSKRGGAARIAARVANRSLDIKV